jgi:hypothetical protein
MKCVPPVLHGRDWDWPSDGDAEAWPEYLGRIPVPRLIRQAEPRDNLPQFLPLYSQPSRRDFLGN